METIIFKKAKYDAVQDSAKMAEREEWRNVKYCIIAKKGEKIREEEGSQNQQQDAEKEKDCERTAEAADSWTSNELNLRGESTAETNISASSLVSSVPRHFYVAVSASASLSSTTAPPAIVFLDSASKEIRARETKWTMTKLSSTFPGWNAFLKKKTGSVTFRSNDESKMEKRIEQMGNDKHDTRSELINRGKTFTSHDGIQDYFCGSFTLNAHQMIK